MLLRADGTRTNHPRTRHSGGLYSIFGIAQKDCVTATWVQTFETERASRFTGLDPARIDLRWERRSFEGVGDDRSDARAGSRYRPAIGVESREENSGRGDRVRGGWVHGGDRLIERHCLNVDPRGVSRTPSVWVPSRQCHPGVRSSTPDAPRFQPLRAGRPAVGFRSRADRYTTGIGSPCRIGPPGTCLGTFDSRDSIAFSVQSALPSPNGEARVEVTPSTDGSVVTFVHYNSAMDAVIGNVRFRYNPSKAPTSTGCTARNATPTALEGGSQDSL